MSTGSKEKESRAANERGISLVELLIAAMATGLFALMAARLVTRPQELIESAGGRLSDQQIAEQGYRTLLRRLSQTSVMKIGILECTGNAVNGARAVQALPIIRAEGERISFAYSSFSALVGISSTTLNEILVPDAAKYPVDTLVLLTHVNDSGFGGLFRVEAVVGSRVRLNQTSLNSPASVGCGLVSGRNNTLYDLSNDDSHRMFGSVATTFRSDVVSYASYSLAPSPRIRGPLDLMVVDWPRNPAAVLAIPGVSSLAIEQGWREEESGDEAGLRGRLTFNVTVTRTDRMPAQITAGGRPFQGQVSVPLGGSLRRNFGAATAPVAMQLVFPTCGLAGTPIPGTFLRQTAPSKLANIYKIEPMMSNLRGRAASIFVVTRGGAAECWHSGDSDEILVASTGNPPVVSGKPKMRANGASGFAMAPGSTGAMEPWYCDMENGAILDGRLSYFDELLGKSMSVPCTGFAVENQIVSFRYSGAASGCSKNTGIIRFGKLVRTADVSKGGPPLFVDDTSCQWETGGVAGSFESCRQTDAQGNLMLNRKLLKVRLRPSNITVQGATNAASCQCSHELTCS